MPNREIILQALERVRRRLQLGRALHDAAIVLGMAAVGLLLWRVLYIGAGRAPVIAAAVLAALLLWIGGAALLARRRLALPRTLAEAAGLADTRAGLKDELATARWLLEHHRPSPWIDAQVARAAQTARLLDPAALLPARLNWRELSGSAAVALLVIVACLMPPPAGVSDAAAVPQQLPRAQAEQVQSLRGLLHDASDRTTRKVHLALAMLEGQTATAEAKQRALSEAGQAVEQRGLDAVAMRESLHRLAAGLRHNRRLQELARALEQGDAAAAAKMMQEVAEAHGSMAARKPSGARGEGDEEQQLRRLLAKVANEDQAHDRDTGTAAEEAADRLHRIAQQLAAQDHWNQAGRALEQLRRAVAEEGTSPPSPAHQRATQDAARASDNGDTGTAGARAYAVDSNGLDTRSSAREGGKASAVTDNDRSNAVLGAKVAPLAVQLRREAIRAEGQETGNAAPKNWFYAETKQQQSSVDFEEVSARSQFALGQSAALEGVAVRHRQIVKEYFMALHQRAHP